MVITSLQSLQSSMSLCPVHGPGRSPDPWDPGKLPLSDNLSVAQWNLATKIAKLRGEWAQRRFARSVKFYLNLSLNVGLDDRPGVCPKHSKLNRQTRLFLEKASRLLKPDSFKGSKPESQV